MTWSSAWSGLPVTQTSSWLRLLACPLGSWSTCRCPHASALHMAAQATSREWKRTLAQTPLSPMISTRLLAWTCLHQWQRRCQQQQRHCPLPSRRHRWTCRRLHHHRGPTHPALQPGRKHPALPLSHARFRPPLPQHVAGRHHLPCMMLELLLACHLTRLVGWLPMLKARGVAA